MALDLVRRLGAGEVVAVVNTHQHFDHTFGNVVFTEAYGGLPVIAHEAAAEAAGRDRARAPGRSPATDTDDPAGRDIAATRIVLPTETFSSARVVDLGDRLVELVHPGRGHTGRRPRRAGRRTPTWCSPATSSRSRRSARRCRATATTASRWSGRPPSTW